MKKWNLLLVLVLSLGLTMTFVGCNDDDDDDDGGVGPEPMTVEEQMIGVWESSGDNVAPLLVAVFNYDTVVVTFQENNIVSLNSHVADGAWTGAINGTYAVEESQDMDVHTITLAYPTFEQEGIVELYENGDMMRLEVVQTQPQPLGTPRTPETGFGSDPALGNTNIQVYARVEAE